MSFVSKLILLAQQWVNFILTRPVTLKLFRQDDRRRTSTISRVSRRADLREGKVISAWERFLSCQREEANRVTVDPGCCPPEAYARLSQWYTSRVSHRTSRWEPERNMRSRSYSGEMIWEAMWALAHAQLKPGLKVLDVGAENSFMPIYLAAQGAEVFVADKWLGSYGEFFEANALGQCFSRAFVIKVKRDDGSSSRVTYQKQDATRLEFPDNTFDLVLCLSVIEHIVEDSLAASEMGRVLKPGGMLVITTPIGPAWQQRSDTPHHKGADGKWEGDLDRIYSAETLFSRLIEPSKLELMGESDFSLDWHNKKRYQMPGASPDFASAAIFLIK